MTWGKIFNNIFKQLRHAWRSITSDSKLSPSRLSCSKRYQLLDTNQIWPDISRRCKGCIHTSSSGFLITVFLDNLEISAGVQIVGCWESVFGYSVNPQGPTGERNEWGCYYLRSNSSRDMKMTILSLNIKVCRIMLKTQDNSPRLW